jgi:tripartite-type tricarboxylate transporter receptor subunit TctC
MTSSAGSARSTTLSRRRCLQGLAAALGVPALPASAFGTGWRQGACDRLRDQRVSWIVGWTVGGGFDVYSRLLEPTLESLLRTEIAIRNVPGASGLVGASRLATAPPDGLTLGILYGAGLMLAPYTNPGFAPDLRNDFTILGRIVDQRQMLVVGPQLGIGTLDRLITLGRERPLVFGATGPTTMSVLLQSAVARMFGLRIELVLGFPGTQQLLPAVVRGDLDGTITSQESAHPIEGLVPLLRLAPVADERPDPSPGRVPELFGADGLVARRPELLSDPGQAATDAEALEALLRIGRLVAAPAGLPGPVASCLRDAVAKGLADPELQTRADRVGRHLAPATARQVEGYIRDAAARLPRFGDLLRGAIERASG